jgi:hypothetical protein
MGASVAEDRPRLARRILREYGGCIDRAAREQGLEPWLLAGLVAVESRGNRLALRYEPHYRWLFGDQAWEDLKRPAGLTRETEFCCQRMSWGLCQVMLAVAREYGFDGWPPALCDPELNLHYGSLHLARQLARERKRPPAGGREPDALWRALRRYNGSEDYPPLVLGWSEIFKAVCQDR